MVSIRGFKRPIHGSGTLFYFSGQPDDDRVPPLVFRFSSRYKWSGDQPAPFAWRLIEPFGELRYPVLDLVADRDTEIIPPKAYDRAEGPQPSEAFPFVRVLRPQIADGVPQEDSQFDVDRILGNSDETFGTGERTRRAGRTADPGLHRFHIHHLPVGNQGKLRGRPICVVTNVLGKYQLQLTARSIWKPTAYWIQIFDTQDVLRGHTAIVWAYIDRNIELKNLHLTDEPVRLEAYRRFLAGTDERIFIPRFADNVRVSQAGWPAKHEWRAASQTLVRIRLARPEGYWWHQFVGKAEDLIGFIPIAGDVYDIGSVAYMSVTGKAPWTGERVPRSMSIIYAAAAIGPISVSRIRRLKTFATGLPPELLRLSDNELQLGIERALAPEVALRMAAAATDEGMRDLKLRLISTFSRKISSSSFATYYSRLLGEVADTSTLQARFDAMLKYTEIGTVFESPSLLKEPLKSGYQAYLTKHGVTADTMPPLEWTRQQSTGTYATVLARALGPNYRGHLRVLAGSGSSAVRRETLDVAVRALNSHNYYDNYGDLCERSKYLYPVVERDHIFESRFLLNNPDFADTMDTRQATLAVLVPANQTYLAQLRQIDPKVHAEYCHADKRPLMQRLPDNKENLYSLQAMWDVHVDTYNQLGVRVTPTGTAFGANVYRELGYNLDYLAADLVEQARILRANGWHARADVLVQKATYTKRIDPNDRAFRRERFDLPKWWEKADS